MKNTLETRLGVFVALVAIAAILILETLGGVEKFRSGRHVSALFNNVNELHVGDRVKMAGVEVGTVDAIRFAENKVEVTMKLGKKAIVRTDSTATIKFAGLMGQNYVSIDFGSPTAPPVDDGAVLNGVEQADISSIMQKLDNVAGGIENITKTFSGDKLDNILGPLTDFMKQNTGPLTITIGNLRAISTVIAEGRGTMGKFIHDDALYTSAIKTMTNLQSTIANAQRIVDGINAGEGTLGRLAKDETLYRETTTSMTNLKEILQKINQGQGSVGKLINDQEFYKNAKLTLQKVDKATEGLEDSGPLDVLGMAVKSLF
ncbi:MAG TPA: MlaD family protein [Verrucomicrobiae bacterium]|jgi:phospholipid/cholesterol/gamma-HCH transport system substrate-binding protein